MTDEPSALARMPSPSAKERTRTSTTHLRDHHGKRTRPPVPAGVCAAEPARRHPADACRDHAHRNLIRERSGEPYQSFRGSFWKWRKSSKRSLGRFSRRRRRTIRPTACATLAGLLSFFSRASRRCSPAPPPVQADARPDWRILTRPSGSRAARRLQPQVPAEAPVPALAVTPSPSAGEAQPADKPPVVRTILAVQTGTVCRARRQILLAELKAFESLRGEKRELFLTQTGPRRTAACLRRTTPPRLNWPSRVPATGILRGRAAGARAIRSAGGGFAAAAGSRSRREHRRLSLARRRQRKTTRSRPLWRFRTRNALRCSAERTVA